MSAPLTPPVAMGRILLPTCLAMLLAGSSWAGSLRVPSELANIQLAIDSAAPHDTVFVEPGVYSGEGNRNLNFRGKNIVVLGVEGPAETIIDCEGSELENARGFIFESGERFTAVVTGLTIRNGYQVGTTFETFSGGGILIVGDGTSPTIRKCVFEDNFSFKCGGGIAVGDFASPTIAYCTFLNNTGRTGGGGACVVGEADFAECEFIGNHSPSGDGGAIKFADWSRSVIRDCIFRDNSARNGGALDVSIAAPQIIECDFIGNTATFRYGGAVFTSRNADPEMSSCVFTDNTAETEGGAIFCDWADVILENCTIANNSAPVSACISVGDGTIQATHTIMAFGIRGEGVACTGTGSVDLNCCDAYGNEGGDWVGCIAGQASTHGNMSADPLFCNVGHQNLHLAETSPCAEAATECGLIGRYGVACTSSVEEATWGDVKALYSR